MFAGTLATRVVLLPPKDPESKGIVERRNGFFETSFMPARHFTGPADFNDQVTDWLTGTNTRVMRTLKAHNGLRRNTRRGSEQLKVPAGAAATRLGRRDLRIAYS